MTFFFRATALTIFSFAASLPLHASTLEISPVLIDVMTETAAATTIRLRNRSVEPVRVQLRMHRWQQTDGEDVLKPAGDGIVAVSPPFVTLNSGVENIVRIARLAKGAVTGEETYRLLIDELPPPALPDGQVRLAMRHSIPIFFRSANAKASRLSWRLSRTDGVTSLVASNEGERRVRITQLSIRGGTTGVETLIAPGLAGYVLGGSSKRWVLRTGEQPVSVTFNSETGAERQPISAYNASINAPDPAFDAPS